MGVSVEQWRAAVGSYNAGKSCSLAHSSSSRVPVLLSDLFSLLCSVATTSLQSVMKALMLLILLSGDVERNPGPDIMDRRPTMPELADFPGKTRHFNIATEIGMQYYMVGTALLNDERGAIVPAIISEHRGNAEQISMDILSRWVQGKGIADHTWRGLLGVLRVHCPGLAQDIEETLRAENHKVHKRGAAVAPETDPPQATSAEAGSSHTPPQLQAALPHFSEQLRARYAKYPLQHHSSPQCRKWMPHVSKEYIHPDIISKEEQEEQPDSHKEAVLRGQRWRFTEKGSGDTIQLEKLIEARCGENCECVLVEGGPGMGKSTLAWQVCHRWGRRELFDQYSTVLLLPLRDERVQQAKQVEDLFFHLRDKKAQKQVKRGINNGRDTLIILDGLDELPGHLLLKRSIFTDLLSGEVLGDATILVTSRPSATLQLLTCWKQRMSKHFVIHGFNEWDIEKYAQSILSGEKLTKFKNHLSIHPHMKSIMYVPLHSAIVMAVYLRHKQLPTTPTQLYTWLVKTILSQYITDHPEYSGEDEVHVLGLKLPKTVHAYFIQLSKFAFKNVCDRQLIFTDMPEELHDLGFTDSVPELFLPESCSYNFLHLSIQEFLAAYHVSLQSPQEQEQLLLIMRSREEHHFKNMMRFVAGLTKFEGIRKEAMKQVVVVDKRLQLGEAMYCLDDYSLELLYECQNVSVLDKEDTYSANMSWSYQAHHYLALGYCIANSKCAWKLSLRGRQPDNKRVNVQMLLQGLQDCKAQPAYTIKSIRWTLYSEIYYGKLLDFLKHTESMELTPDDQSDLTHFCQWLPTCRLKTLTLLRLKSHNIEMVSRALNAVPSPKILIMLRSEFTLQSMHAFASMLQQNQSLTTVDIRDCSIDSDSACCLARALHSNTTLTVLNMSENSAGESGALAMAEMLTHNTTLTWLYMGENSVGERGALAMAEMLKHNTTLTELDTSDDTIGAEGIKALVESLAVNYHLNRLWISYEYKKEVEALPAYHANKECGVTEMKICYKYK